MALVTGRELKIDVDVEGVKESYQERKNKVPIIEILQQALQDLLHDVFNKHIRISAATKDILSEAKLSAMIIEHCLKMTFNKTEYEKEKEKFKKRLEEHLKRHYNVHRTFLEEL